MVEAMTTPSLEATNKFRGMRDGDEARDLALDYDADQEAQYADYRDWCAESGVEPLPFYPKVKSLTDNPVMRMVP